MNTTIVTRFSAAFQQPRAWLPLSPRRVLAQALAGLMLVNAVLAPVQAAELNIADGVVVKFGTDAGLVVRDRLVAGKEVSLSSYRDDDAVGPLKAEAQAPAPGDWRGVRIEKSAASFGALSLNGWRVSHAGAQGDAALTVRGWSPAISNAWFGNNLVGLRLQDGANSLISVSSFIANSTGVEVQAAQPRVSASQFAGNATGLSNLTPDTPVTATGNWWGHASGPKAASNPAGQGDAVSAGVDFGGFQTALPLLNPSIRLVNAGSTLLQRKIELDLACGNATEYRIAENEAFAGVAFSPLPQGKGRVPYMLSAADGAKSLSVQFRNETGVVASAALADKLTLDTLAPVVEILSPANGAVLSQSIQIEASASDTSGIASASLWIDDAQVASFSTGSIKFAWDISALANGSAHRIKVVALDKAGRSASNEVLVTISKLSSQHSLVVSGQANIYGAGRAVAPAPGGGGGGLLPPMIELDAVEGQVISFASVSGTVSCCAGTAYFNDADGRASAWTINGVGGLGGIKHASRSMYLTGVFLGDAEPQNPAPAMLDVTDLSSLPAYAPALQQVFFIGDGLTGTGSGEIQQFHVPAGATRFYIGFADQASGSVGTYSDNQGSLIANFTITQPPSLDTSGPQFGEAALDAQTVVQGFTITRSGTVSVSVADASGVARVEMLLNGALHGVLKAAGGKYSGRLDISALANGSHVVTLRATDSLGNVSTVEYSFTVAHAAPDAPVLSSPAAGSVTREALITVSGSAKAGSALQLLLAGEPQGAPVNAGSDGRFSAPLTLLPGVNRIQATASDQYGSSAASAVLQITLDQNVPAAPAQLTATAQAGGKIRLGWSASTDPNATAYHVYRAPTPFALAAEATRIASKLAVTVLEDIPPQDGTWYYRVTAVNAVGTESLPGNQAQAVADGSLPAAQRIRYAPQGKTDPATGRVGQGMVDVQLTVSEPLLIPPYLSIVPQGGVPIPVTLMRTDDLNYSGSFRIDGNTLSGPATALFSARDAVGNRGTEVKEGASLLIDTAGPEIVGITLEPAAPIRNDSAQSISASFRFSKAPAAAPQIRYLLSGAVRSPVEVSGLVAVDALTWRASFTLPSDAGAGSPESFSFSHQSRDDLDNLSNRISAANRFQVYQGELPPADVPFGFSAKAQPGGKVLLAWQPVTDAGAYQIYRQAPGEAALSPLVRTTGVEHIDQTSADGLYRYAVASVRVSNGQERVSGQTTALEVNASATAPGAPENLTLTLTGKGIYAAWQAPLASSVDYYNLYRASGTAIHSIEGLTPYKTRIKTPQVYDTAPSASAGAYVVTAVDAAGNESAISNSAYLNASLLPVRNLRIEQVAGRLPVLSWAAPNGSIAGYKVYVGPESSRIALTPAPITATTLTDTGYTSGERRYTVAAVDASAVELPRSLLLPALSAQIASGLPIRRGVMNRIQVQLANASASALEGVRAVVRLPVNKEATQFKDHKSEVISLGAGETRLVSVIVGGYTDLPGAPQAEVGAEISAIEGELVRITRNQVLEVGEGSLVIGMATEEFTRGATGKLRLTVENTSEVDVELLTATSHGNKPSSELRFKLLDADGNVLATQPYHQALGANVVTLPNGLSVARIPAGSRYVSDLFELAVPAASPDNLRVRLEVDKLRYHSGQEDEVSIAGRGAERNVSLRETAYYGELTELSPISSFGDEPIVITGRAVDRASQAPMGNTRLRLILNQQGFERSFAILTDADGSFTHRFTPTLTDAGLFKVSAVHPEMTDRPEQRAFSINRLSVSPAQYRLDVPKNYPFDIPLKVVAATGSSASNVRFVLNAASQPTGELPEGVSLTLPAPVNLAERQTLNLPVRFLAGPAAQPSGSIVLDLVSDEHPHSPIARARVEYKLTEAKPYLIPTPAFVETGLVQGGSDVSTVTVKNAGVQDAFNLRFALLKPDGSPAPAWASIASEANGSLAVGESRSIDLAFAPPASTAEGVYEYRLQVSGDNVPTQSLNVFVSLTQSGQGGVLFKAADIYTATPGEGGKLIEGLGGATITLQNEDVSTLSYEMKTDSLGEALFQGVPAGRYRFRAQAINHQEVAGRLLIKPGITLNQPVFLDYNLITVEWSVREITIQDRYEITLTATFETDVPAAVLMLQPSSVNLPKMAAGDVYYGELTLTNYGLYAAQKVRQTLPGSDEYFRFEFLVDVPDSLGPKQRLVIPYRVIAIKSLEDAASSGNASGGGCYSWSKLYRVDGEYKCANGQNASCGSGTRWYSQSHSTCPPGTGGTYAGGGGGGGGGGGWSGGGYSSPLPTGNKCTFIPKGGEPQSCPTGF